MGGPSGSGGSDKSDDRKVDTYADQLKKIQAKKSKYKINEFGYKVKKNPFERYKEISPVGQILTAVEGQHNLNRRMKFANKHGINIQGLSTTEILSKDFKSKLDEKGYSVEPGNVGRKNDGGNNNQQTAEKSIVQPKVESQMDNTGVKSKLIIADKTSPTTTEMSEDERMIGVKRKGRKVTTLTDINESKKPTLSKKVLLGV